MKAYFEGEKGVLVFKPLPVGKCGRAKRKTNEDRLKSMDTKELAHELALIAEWDRSEVEKAKNRPGLEGFMEKWLKGKALEGGYFGTPGMLALMSAG